MDVWARVRKVPFERVRRFVHDNIALAGDVDVVIVPESLVGSVIPIGGVPWKAMIWLMLARFFWFADCQPCLSEHSIGSFNFVCRRSHQAASDFSICRVPRQMCQGCRTHRFSCGAIELGDFDPAARTVSHVPFFFGRSR